MSGYKCKFVALLWAVCSIATITAHAVSKASLKEQAWDLLRAGVDDEKVPHRATAVRVLSLLPGEAEARTLAAKALQDQKPEVRAAGACCASKQARGNAQKTRRSHCNQKSEQSC